MRSIGDEIWQKHDLESLPAFLEIVLSDKRKNEDENLIALAEKTHDAINRDKYMIHFGV